MSLAVLLAVGLGLSACAHNDVLVFGTDTKLGLDVETGAAQGASPSVTIGYKRQEAVWMPLFVNGEDSRYAPAAQRQPVQGQGANVGGGGETGNGAANPALTPDPEMKYQSVQGDRRDAYSVFASLGADIKGDAPKGQGSMGLAQFFATGGAAINITQNKALVTALKIESAEGAEQQSAAVAAAAGDPAIIAAAGVTRTEAGKAADCVSKRGTNDIAAKVNAAHPGDPDIADLNAENARQLLTNNSRLRARVLAVCN
ncbi:hypothetical protein SGCZBJ_02980 [Caulobacter zeae]|uniref:Uncharacterized protein n=1 Tax=Caulobacter zeae TaxID=2055137 RepID=A0A2N5DQV0_9CAUL|nr:hypothetical protein [Caulobacter zeae]PLR28426.1 hypothetical protein SGCZBJ_02980 [Caulobacter zeae]